MHILTFLIEVPSDVVWSIGAVILTNGISYFWYMRRMTSMHKNTVVGLKQFIEDIFVAITNSNGYGTIFKKEYDDVVKQRETLDKRTKTK